MGVQRRWPFLLALFVGGLLLLLLWPRRPPKRSVLFLRCALNGPTYARVLDSLRRAKDSLFRYDPNSPIPPSARAHFLGLRYFPLDTSWRLFGRFEPLPKALPPIIGQVWLNLPGMEHCRAPTRLLVYGSREGRPFLAFWDSTAALGQTYEGGRYVPIDTAEGQACVDFNCAYFPYCAYDPAYLCLPYPPENRLCVRISAGERW